MMRVVIIGVAAMSMIVAGHRHEREQREGGLREWNGGRREHHHRDHREKHYEKVVQACSDDVSTYCSYGDVDFGTCFVENAGCFSSECIDAVNHAAKGERHHREHRRGHGHHGVPKAVKRACKADKKRLCGDLHGWEAKQCVVERAAELSTECTTALNQWVASMPAPPAAVLSACAVDQATFCNGLEGFALFACTKENYESFSGPCQQAIIAFRHSVHHPDQEPTAVAPPVAPSPVAPSPVAPSPLPPVAPPSPPVSTPEQVDTPVVQIFMESASSQPIASAPMSRCGKVNTAMSSDAVEVVNKAFSPDAQPDHHGHRHGRRFIGAAVSVVGIAVVLAVIVVVIRRVRRARLARSQVPATIPHAQVIVNPLASTTDAPYFNGQHYIVTGVPVTM